MLREQDTGRSDRLGTANSRIGRTQTTQSPTPLPARRPNRRRGNCPSQSPDDRISSPQRHVLQAPTFATQRRPPSTPCFSIAGANIGRRRAQHSSMLLTSPARPGHASRVRQIFDEAATLNTTSCHAGIALYPQLPNISRVASPPTSGQRGRNAFRHPSPGTTLQHPKPLPASTPESSSESWSDDSGYIVLDHARPLAGASPPAHRIEDWLSTVTLASNETGEPSNQAETCNESCLQASFEQDDLQMAAMVDTGGNTSTNRPMSDLQTVQLKLPCDNHMPFQDPFVTHLSSGGSSTGRSAAIADYSYRSSTSTRWQRHVSDICKRLHFESLESATENPSAVAPSTPNPVNRILSDPADDGHGGIELSPLSPNVCIERGPSRYHSANRNRTAESPLQPSMRTSFQFDPQYFAGLAKENTTEKDLMSSARAVRGSGSVRKSIRS